MGSHPVMKRIMANKYIFFLNVGFQSGGVANIYVCIYTYMYVYAAICMYVYIYVCICPHLLYTGICISINLSTYPSYLVQTNLTKSNLLSPNYLSIYLDPQAHAYIYIYIYTYTQRCMYIYIYTHTYIHIHIYVEAYEHMHTYIRIKNA